MCALCGGGGLKNAAQSEKLEAIQRGALNVILGKESRSYRKNMAKLEVETLSARRLFLTKKFAVRTLLSQRHSHQCFTPNPNFTAKTRLVHSRLLLPVMDTLRGDFAPYSHMANLINNMDDDEFNTISKGILPLPRPPTP